MCSLGWHWSLTLTTDGMTDMCHQTQSLTHSFSQLRVICVMIMSSLGSGILFYVLHSLLNPFCNLLLYNPWVLPKWKDVYAHFSTSIDANYCEVISQMISSDLHTSNNREINSQLTSVHERVVRTTVFFIAVLNIKPEWDKIQLLPDTLVHEQHRIVMPEKWRQLFSPLTASVCV